MIELIFALVIIGITLLSAPILIQQSIASSNVGLQQEAIAVVASHTGILLASHWDEADANTSSKTAAIITVIRNPAVANDPFAFTTTRAGMKNILARTTHVGGKYVFSSGSFGFDADDDNLSDDIDDYHDRTIGLSVYNNENTTTATGDYVDTELTINTTITYADDITTLEVNTTANDIFNNSDISGESNIKFVTTRLTTSSVAEELSKDITLKAFSCNIGTFLPAGDTEY